MINTSHPFYKKKWVRVAIPSICILWAFIEYLIGSQNWALFFGIIGVYSGFILLVRYRKRDEEKKKKSNHSTELPNNTYRDPDHAPA